MKPTLYLIAGCNGAGNGSFRVAKRVSEGGHNIPTETIHRRYWLGLQNFFKIFTPIVDSWSIYDNIDSPLEIANESEILDERNFIKIKESMSEQEKIDLRAKIKQGLNQSYESLLRRKAALGQDMVIADAKGQPVVVSAKELLARRTDSDNCKRPNK